jgi:3-phosphoinositide dependent protein kinase-1
LYDINAIKII